MSAARYLTIKQTILKKIRSGVLCPGDALPSENQLSVRHRVSRMTARRALTELVQEGVLVRSQGLGTFVADELPSGSLLKIRSIHQEILERGHRHSCRVLALEVRDPDPMSTHSWKLGQDDKVYFSRIVHLEQAPGGDPQPIQLEERFIHAGLVPAYIEQDFTKRTPSEYLMEVAPLSEAEHAVEACLPSAKIAAWLEMKRTLPCLKLVRKTYSRFEGGVGEAQLVSLATLYHPGDRYRLVGQLRTGVEQ